MGKLVNYIIQRKHTAILLLIFSIFLLLLFKDPFSQRTLIPNFEPYPDTFYYINPALNLIKGQGFNINREDRVFNTNVPPLYSFSLIPAFLLKADPRMAYYSNIILALISFTLFRLILKKVLKNNLIVYSLLILYITNYFIYWVPALIMAENLTLTLFLGAVYFLTLEIKVINSIIIAVLAVGIYATKFASIPILVSIILLFFIKILYSRLFFKHKIKQGLFFLLVLVISYLVLEIFLQTSKQYSVISQIIINLSSIQGSITKAAGGDGKTNSATGFGIQYIKQNLPVYINSLIGSPNKFLWNNIPLIPRFVAIGGILGILGGILNKQFRFISFTLFTFILATVFFQSTFYSFDARYIYIAIPTLLIGLGLFFANIEDQLVLNKKIILNFLIIVIICVYLISSLARIKSQISLNLRYAETPWNYIAVLKTNEYFTPNKIKQSKEPVLISALPPFLVDYYSNGNYTLLPLSYEQEFRGQYLRETIWGPNDYSDLPKLYQKYLDEGYDVYVSRSGIGEESYTNHDFNIVMENFETELVLSGCYNQCSIYSVKLKTSNAQ